MWSRGEKPRGVARHSRNQSSSRGSRVFRPQFEPLEDRSMLTTFYAATALDLINDINAANRFNGSNTIVLTADTTSHYVFQVVDNKTDGGNMLPLIKKGDHLTIVTDNGSADPGYGDFIDA